MIGRGLPPAHALARVHLSDLRPRIEGEGTNPAVEVEEVLAGDRMDAGDHPRVEIRTVPDRALARGRLSVVHPTVWDLGEGRRATSVAAQATAVDGGPGRGVTPFARVVRARGPLHARGHVQCRIPRIRDIVGVEAALARLVVGGEATVVKISEIAGRGRQKISKLLLYTVFALFTYPARM